MARIVMKFGGTSMAGTERIRRVANIVRRQQAAGHEVAVVVSAMAGETDRLVGFWAGMGSNVECMSVERHDLVLAITSHLPHLIAYNIVGTAADLEKVTESEVMKFSAGGFRDFTRIAASDPTMWRDVFLHNKDAVLEVLGRFQEDLFALQRQIRWGEGDKLYDLFTRTRTIRRGILTLGQDAPEADFGRAHRPVPKAPSE